MAKRKAVRKEKKRVVKGRKAAKAGRKMRAGKKAKPRKKRKRAGRRSVQPRVWRRTARLAQDALTALDEGDLDEVRECLQAVHAVAQCADGQ